MLRRRGLYRAEGGSKSEPGEGKHASTRRGGSREDALLGISRRSRDLGQRDRSWAPASWTSGGDRPPRLESASREGRGALAVLVSAMLDHCSISHKGTLFPLPSSSRTLLTVVSVLQAVSSSGRAPSRLQHHIPQHPPPLQSTPWSAKPLSKAAARTESTRKMAMRSSGHLSTTWSSFSSCVLHPKPDIRAS